MIVFTGVAALELTYKENGFAPEAGGYSFRLCREVRALSPQTGFISALSSDIPGQLIIDTMVKECIVFDPSLIYPDKPSALIFRCQDDESRIISLTAPVTLCEEALSESYATSSDLRALHLSAEGLYHQPLFSSSLNAALFKNPRPVLIIDPATSSFAHPDTSRYRRQLEEAVGQADILLLDEGEQDLKVEGRSVIFFEEHTDFGSFVIDHKLSKAAVLAALNNNGRFGTGIEKPCFKGFFKEDFE